MLAGASVPPVGGAIGAGAVGGEIREVDVGGAMGDGTVFCAITELVAKTSALIVRCRLTFSWASQAFQHDVGQVWD